MKILVYGINFFPEIVGIGKYTHEMCLWLSKKHDVRVICGQPYYPAWKVFDGYDTARFSSTDLDGVKILRAPLWVPSRPTGLKRLAHLFSFAISSFYWLIRSIWWKPAIVVLVAPPLACAPGALLFAKVASCKSWLHIQDFEVDAAFRMGMLRGSTLRRAALWIERVLLKKFDRVSTISGEMVRLTQAKGVASEKVVHFPNWANIDNIRPLGRKSTYREILKIADDEKVVLYSGNMGTKQGLELLSFAARKLLNKKNVKFVFCGEGAGLELLKAQCEGLSNVVFLGFQPLELLGEFLGVADIHLMPQREDAADLVMPSKLTGMLASGRPIVATARWNTELGRVVGLEAQAGLLVEPGDASGFADAIEELADSDDRRDFLGANGRRYAERMLDKDVLLRRFEVEIERCVANIEGSQSNYDSV